MKPFAELVIPKYLLQVKLSNKRRAKYYKKKKNGKWYPRQLPKTYKDKVDSGEWSINSKGYLLEEDGSKRLANPQAAGTPNYETLSGNAFMSGFGSHHIRRKLTSEMKKFYTKFVREQLEPFDNGRLPLIITWDFYAPIETANWDMDNKSFYWKYLQDTLVDEGIIPDDTIQFITCPPAGRFYPVEKEEDRKFVFKFYTDTRKNIVNYYTKHELLLP